MTRSLTLLTLYLVLAGCGGPQPADPGLNRMVDQPRFDRYDANPVFADGATLRPPPVGSVAREDQSALPAGRTAQGYRQALPVPVTAALLQQGRQLFERDCAICHGARADGQSFVASRMLQVPPADLQRPRYRAYPIGRIVAVIDEGYGAMAGFGDSLTSWQRWAIAAYLVCLQRSQQLVLDDLPPARAQRIRDELSVGSGDREEL